MLIVTRIYPVETAGELFEDVNQSRAHMPCAKQHNIEVVAWKTFKQQRDTTTTALSQTWTQRKRFQMLSFSAFM